MGSTCTIINVGVPPAVCTGSTPCADGSLRECRSDEFYWDCVDGCWKKGVSCHVDPCDNDPCGATCTDCAKCPGLQSCIATPPEPPYVPPGDIDCHCGCGTVYLGGEQSCEDACELGCVGMPPIVPIVPPEEPPYTPPEEPPYTPPEEPPYTPPEEPPMVTPPTEGNINEGGDMYKYILIGGLALIGVVVLVSGGRD